MGCKQSKDNTIGNDNKDLNIAGNAKKNKTQKN